VPIVRSKGFEVALPQLFVAFTVHWYVPDVLTSFARLVAEPLPSRRPPR
jgi:hypothetical protein